MKAVLFDLFETLVSEFDVEYPGAQDAARALGLDVARFCRAYGSLPSDRYVGKIAGFGAAVRNAAERLGFAPPEEIVAQLDRKRRDAFSQHLSDVEPDILRMLADLEHLGIRIGVVSNTEGSEVAGWDDSPLSTYVHVTAFSHEVGHAKPDPRIYREACRRLNVLPGLCAYVGDGGSDEIRGAARLGMSPYCAAWFLRRHTHLLGPDVLRVRAAGYPVLLVPAAVVDRLVADALRDDEPHREPSGTS